MTSSNTVYFFILADFSPHEPFFLLLPPPLMGNVFGRYITKPHPLVLIRLVDRYRTQPLL